MCLVGQGLVGVRETACGRHIVWGECELCGPVFFSFLSLTACAKGRMGQGASADEEAGKEVAGDDELANTLDELLILEGHRDIVRIACVVNHELVATAADDTTIRVWDWRSGALAAVLEGHQRPITCLLKLTNKRIASGSSDGKIFIWNVQTGMRVRELNFHNGAAVQCIIKLAENRLCSGSTERTLFVWDQDGNEVGRIERQENENLHCMLSVANRIVTGSASSLLLVYNPETWSMVTVLSYHRESVTCLERVNQTQFASGSLDGAIVVWNADTLKPAKVLSFPDRYRSEQDHIFLYHVRSLASLNQRYLVCAIGNGFALFDLYTGERILDKADAHDAACLQVLPLYRGRKIVSCSDDGTIRLWGAAQELDQLVRNQTMPTSLADPYAPTTMSPAGSNAAGFSSQSPLSPPAAGGGTSESTFRNLFSSKKKTRINAPLLLGEMTVHSGSVLSVVSVNQTTFVSVGSDGLVVVWKDSRIQKQLRNNLANASLLTHVAGAVNSSTINSSSFSGDSSSLRVPLSPTSPPPAIAEPLTDKTSDAREMQTFPLGDAGSAVPAYILSFARSLRDEKGMSVEQVLEHLAEQGHSKQIVAGVELRL